MKKIVFVLTFAVAALCQQSASAQSFGDLFKSLGSLLGGAATVGNLVGQIVTKVTDRGIHSAKSLAKGLLNVCLAKCEVIEVCKNC